MSEDLPFEKRTFDNIRNSLVGSLRQGPDGGSPSGITDFSPGSVAGTLVGAFAREFATFYEQLELAYSRSFIDTAEGKALDNVVALLGVTRKPAEPARGMVEFTLKQKGTNAVSLPAGTRVSDTAGRIFELVKDGNIATGCTKSPLLAVVALEPGPKGNVEKGSITRMPTPPAGFTGTVSNPEPLVGGLPEEGDSELRNRAKHELERAGKSTLTALKYSLLKVQGIDAVDVLDHASDASLPLGEVRVVFSPADLQDLRIRVEEAIEDNRAAGIRVRVECVTKVNLIGTIHILPSPEFEVENTLTEFLNLLAQAIDKLKIGESVYIRRILALVYQVRGLLEVAEADLKYTKTTADGFESGAVELTQDLLAAGRSEWIRLAKDRLDIGVLNALRIESAPRTDSDEVWFDLTFEILGIHNEILKFKNFKLDIDLLINAGSSSDAAETSPKVSRKEYTLHFHGTDCATLMVDDPWLAEDAKSLGGAETWRTFQAIARNYPALRSDPVRVNLDNATASPLPQGGSAE